MEYDINSVRWKKKSLLIFFGIFLLCCLFYIFLESSHFKFKVVVSSLFENKTSNKIVSIKKISKDAPYILNENGDMKLTNQRRRLWAHIHPNSMGLKTPIKNSKLQEDYQMTYFNNHNGNTKYAVDNILIDRLSTDLEYKLKNVLPEDNTTIFPTCVEQESIDNSCDKEGCLQLQLPESAKSRIEQLVGHPFLRVSDEYKKVLDYMGNSVPDYYNIILTTAASKNHYEESKTLLINLHKNVFPYLKNFTLVYYDIGLSEWQREDITSICQCQIRKFPFSRFPYVFSTLKCYAWKPMIIYAHASHCNLLFWMDSSIRFFEDQSKLEELFELASVHGLITGTASNKISRVTLKSTFHFFGDEPCAYHNYRQSLSGVVIFHNEPLIHEAVLEPFAACALNESCMCPYQDINLKEVIRCHHKDKSFLADEFGYGRCHRFDQSVLSIIIRKVFREKSHHIIQRHLRKFLSIKRGDKSSEDS